MANPIQIKPKKTVSLFPDLSRDWYADGITWRECSEGDYNYALGVVPPERFTMSGFLMGEPFTHTRTDVVFAVFVSIAGRFFAKYCEDGRADQESRTLLVELERQRQAREANDRENAPLIAPSLTQKGERVGTIEI